MRIEAAGVLQGGVKAKLPEACKARPPKVRGVLPLSKVQPRRDYLVLGQEQQLNAASSYAISWFGSSAAFRCKAFRCGSRRCGYIS